MSERTFDYRPRLDDRNLAYRLTAADPTLMQRSRYWTPGVVLDQGQEGSCVGHGVVGEWLASPARGRLPWNAMFPSLSRESLGHAAAVDLYRAAQRIDEWEGESYSGTSVRAGMLVGRERGWWTGFRWALNMGELRAGLEEGPVVIGVEWYDGMYSTDRHGSVIPTGNVVGGHCLLITGYSPNWNGWGPHFRWRNSWGREYGINGSAYIASADLNRILFQAGGEAAVAVGRKA